MVCFKDIQLTILDTKSKKLGTIYVEVVSKRWQKLNVPLIKNFQWFKISIPMEYRIISMEFQTVA